MTELRAGIQQEEAVSVASSPTHLKCKKIILYPDFVDLEYIEKTSTSLIPPPKSTSTDDYSNDDISPLHKTWCS